MKIVQFKRKCSIKFIKKGQNSKKEFGSGIGGLREDLYVSKSWSSHLSSTQLSNSLSSKNVQKIVAVGFNICFLVVVSRFSLFEFTKKKKVPVSLSPFPSQKSLTQVVCCFLSFCFFSLTSPTHKSFFKRHFESPFLFSLMGLVFKILFSYALCSLSSRPQKKCFV